MHPKETKSGIYLLPNLLTTASLFAAFYSLVATLKLQYEIAAIAIFIGILADSLDGRIARMTNTQSAFGAEYDSLSDLVTFGVAPAILLYSCALQQFGKTGWLIAFMYTASVALRLARFNMKLAIADKKYFQGLACPASAAIIAGFVWLCRGELSFLLACIAAGMAIVNALLMVSNVRYYSFKDLDSKGKVPFVYILIIVILFIAIALDPQRVLFFGFLIYALSGPFQTLLKIHKLRGQRKKHKKIY